MNIVRPLCLGTSVSVRASSRPNAACCALVVHTFWPESRQPPSSSRRARDWMPARSEPAAGSENSWHQTSSAASIGPRWRCFWSSSPWAMIVGPSMPTPITSKIPGTPARPISWLTTTWCSGPRPCPPYSAGQVTAARPASASLRCHSRWAATASCSSRMASSPRRIGASRLVLVEPRADPRAVLGQLGRVVEIHARTLPDSTGRSASSVAQRAHVRRHPRRGRAAADRRRARSGRRDPARRLRPPLPRAPRRSPVPAPARGDRAEHAVPVDHHRARHDDAHRPPGRRARALRVARLRAGARRDHHAAAVLVRGRSAGATPCAASSTPAPCSPATRSTSGCRCPRRSSSAPPSRPRRTTASPPAAPGSRRSRRCAMASRRSGRRSPSRATPTSTGTDRRRRPRPRTGLARVRRRCPRGARHARAGSAQHGRAGAGHRRPRPGGDEPLPRRLARRALARAARPADPPPGGLAARRVPAHPRARRGDRGPRRHVSKAPRCAARPTSWRRDRGSADVCVLPAPGRMAWLRPYAGHTTSFRGHHGGLHPDETETWVGTLYS